MALTNPQEGTAAKRALPSALDGSRQAWPRHRRLRSCQKDKACHAHARHVAERIAPWRSSPGPRCIWPVIDWRLLCQTSWMARPPPRPCARGCFSQECLWARGCRRLLRFFVFLTGSMDHWCASPATDVQARANLIYISNPGCHLLRQFSFLSLGPYSPISRFNGILFHGREYARGIQLCRDLHPTYARRRLHHSTFRLDKRHERLGPVDGAVQRSKSKA